MFKILFADDEPDVTEGLRLIVDWESIGIEVVGVALDGNEALQKIRKLKPDIVIADVHMPGVGGLQLLKEFSEEADPPRFIMFTGYGQMDYIRTAMRYGAAGYIMKPLDPIEIKETVEDVCQKISMKRAQDEEYDETLKYVYQEVFQKLLNGVADGELYTRASFLIKGSGDILSEKDKLGFWLFRLGHLSESERNELNSAIRARLPHAGICVFSIGTRNMIMINVDEYNEQANAIADQIRKYSVGAYTEQLYGIGGLVSVYNNALRNYRHLRNGAVVSETAADQANAMDAEKILKLISDGKNDEALIQVRADITRMREKRVSQEYVYGYAVSLIMLINRYASADGINLENSFDNAMAALSNTFDYDTLTDLCAEYAKEFIDASSSVWKMSAAAISNYVVRYIKDNYNKNIKLSDISNNMHVGVGIISKAIKQGTGMKFNDYLNYVRIQKAKQLLANTSTKITTIASDVGYSDYYYFTNKFKVMVGELPSAYRRTNRNEKNSNDIKTKNTVAQRGDNKQT